MNANNIINMDNSKDKAEDLGSEASSDFDEHMEFPSQVLTHKEDIKKLGNELSKRIHKLKVYK
jgi:hypothetical protein